MDHKVTEPQASTTLDARMVRTRAALKEALLALLESHPFDQITIRDLTAKAGTGYATFFRHYDTKLALLNDVAAAQIAELMRLSFPILMTDDARGAAQALCRYVDGRRALWAALLAGGAAGTMREEFVRQARLVPPVPSTANSWLPDELKVIYGVGATVEILAWWLQSRRDYSVDQVAEILARLVIAPMMAPG